MSYLIESGSQGPVCKHRYDDSISALRQSEGPRHQRATGLLVNFACNYLKADGWYPGRCLSAMVLPHEAGKRLKFNHTAKYEYVLCYNNLNQSNIIVNEETFKISGIIDWEFARFYPKQFESAFYKWSGPARVRSMMSQVCLACWTIAQRAV